MNFQIWMLLSLQSGDVTRQSVASVRHPMGQLTYLLSTGRIIPRGVNEDSKQPGISSDRVLTLSFRGKT